MTKIVKEIIRVRKAATRIQVAASMKLFSLFYRLNDMAKCIFCSLKGINIIHLVAAHVTIKINHQRAQIRTSTEAHRRSTIQAAAVASML